MSPSDATATESAEQTEAPPRHCATCDRSEPDANFGVDRYHCLSCIAARVRDWRRRRKEAAAAAENETEAIPESDALGAAPADTVVVGAVRTSQLTLRLEGYLATSGRSWLELANQSGVDRITLHKVLMGGASTTERSVADALLRAIGEQPESLPDAAGVA